MSQDNQFGGFGGTPSGGSRAADEYGFFASGPPGPPSPAPVSSPPQAPQPQSPVGAALAPGSPFAPAYRPAGRRVLPVWAIVSIVAICVLASFVVLGIVAAIAIPVFLNAHNTPVAPATLGGISRTADPQMSQTVVGAQADARAHNPHIKSLAAGYGTLPSGYLLLSIATPLSYDRELGGLGATTPVRSFGDVRCVSAPSSNTNVCMRVGTRGSVEVASFGTVDLSALAAATDEAWGAQPFGR
jgi:hypothetical protein